MTGEEAVALVYNGELVMCSKEEYPAIRKAPWRTVTLRWWIWGREYLAC